MIPIHISYNIDTIFIILFSVVLGYLFARMFKNIYIIKILDILKIRDTGNKYYWDDLLDENYPMEAKITIDNIIYEGMIHNYESYSNDPHIVLSSYVIKNEYKILEDYTFDNTKIIILDTSKASNVEISYDKNSAICNDLKNLCDYHTHK